MFYSSMGLYGNFTEMNNIGATLTCRMSDDNEFYSPVVSRHALGLKGTRLRSEPAYRVLPV